MRTSRNRYAAYAFASLLLALVQMLCLLLVMLIATKSYDQILYPVVIAIFITPLLLAGFALEVEYQNSTELNLSMDLDFSPNGRGQTRTINHVITKTLEQRSLEEMEYETLDSFLTDFDDFLIRQSQELDPSNPQQDLLVLELELGYRFEEFVLPILIRLQQRGDDLI